MTATTALDLFAMAETLEHEPEHAPESLPWLSSKAEKAAARQRDYERLEPVALALAVRVGSRGFTADDLRAAAITAGVLTGDEGRATGQQRALSWIGPFLVSLARQGKLIARRYADGNPVKRCSGRPEAHANAQCVYTATGVQ